jgi:hypothetical protein
MEWFWHCQYENDNEIKAPETIWGMIQEFPFDALKTLSLCFRDVEPAGAILDYTIDFKSGLFLRNRKPVIQIWEGINREESDFLRPICARTEEANLTLDSSGEGKLQNAKILWWVLGFQVLEKDKSLPEDRNRKKIFRVYPDLSYRIEIDDQII